METIFDHNITPDEIDDLGIMSPFLDIRHNLDFPTPLTEQGYRDIITQEAALFDLALLYEHRGDEIKAEDYFSQVPEKAAEYKRGFDDQIIPI